MGQAEYVAFNGDWHKDCSKCKEHYGASSLEGLHAFFYRSADKTDGMRAWCKKCVKDMMRNRDYAFSKADPLKRRSRQILKEAIRSGKLIRPDRCSLCQIVCKPHGHHTDYSKPLDVMWLCPQCHVKEHKDDYVQNGNERRISNALRENVELAKQLKQAQAEIRQLKAQRGSK